MFYWSWLQVTEYPIFSPWLYQRIPWLYHVWIESYRLLWPDLGSHSAETWTKMDVLRICCATDLAFHTNTTLPLAHALPILWIREVMCMPGLPAHPGSHFKHSSALCNNAYSLVGHSKGNYSSPTFMSYFSVHYSRVAFNWHLWHTGLQESTRLQEICQPWIYLIIITSAILTTLTTRPQKST